MSEDVPARAGSENREALFLKRTLRSAAFMTAFVVFVLASYGLWWSVGPLLVGAGLSALLLWGWEKFIRGVLTPDRVRESREKKGRMPTGALWAFALIKYPLVGLLLWVIARHWDTRQLLAFTGGFFLVHLVIALRALGAALTGNGAGGSGHDVKGRN